MIFQCQASPFLSGLKDFSISLCKLQKPRILFMLREAAQVSLIVQDASNLPIYPPFALLYKLINNVKRYTFCRQPFLCTTCVSIVRQFFKHVNQFWQFSGWETIFALCSSICFLMKCLWIFQPLLFIFICLHNHEVFLSLFKLKQTSVIFALKGQEGVLT